MTSPNILGQFRTICGAVKKHFRLFKNTFRKNITPKNSPAKLWGPKEFSGFLINEHQLIHGSSAVRLAYLYILPHPKVFEIPYLSSGQVMVEGNCFSCVYEQFKVGG